MATLNRPNLDGYLIVNKDVKIKDAFLCKKQTCDLAALKTLEKEKVMQPSFHNTCDRRHSQCDSSMQLIYILTRLAKF